MACRGSETDWSAIKAYRRDDQKDFASIKERFESNACDSRNSTNAWWRQTSDGASLPETTCFYRRSSSIIAGIAFKHNWRKARRRWKLWWRNLKIISLISGAQTENRWQNNNKIKQSVCDGIRKLIEVNFATE